VKEEDTILYGQSVGSGPALELAVHLPRLRAVILHSPILSGLRVMYPVKRTFWFDIYKVFTLNTFLNCSFVVLHEITCSLFIKRHPFLFLLQNIDKIPLVNSPVLVIHVSACILSLINYLLSLSCTKIYIYSGKLNVYNSSCLLINVNSDKLLS
jgi:hypothetical protein